MLYKYIVCITIVFIYSYWLRYGMAYTYNAEQQSLDSDSADLFQRLRYGDSVTPEDCLVCSQNDFKILGYAQLGITFKTADEMSASFSSFKDEFEHWYAEQTQFLNALNGDI